MCYHNHARAFEDLAEFLDHFLFLGSIPQGLSNFRGVAPSARCVGLLPPTRGPNGHSPISPEENPGQKIVSVPPQAGFMMQGITHRSRTNHPRQNLTDLP